MWWCAALQRSAQLKASNRAQRRVLDQANQVVSLELQLDVHMHSHATGLNLPLLQLKQELSRVLDSKGEAVQQQQAAAVKLHLCLEEHSRLVRDRYGASSRFSCVPSLITPD